MIHQKYELSSDGLDLCKGKLNPGIVATWGEIVGDIENQADLVEYVNSHGGGGNAEWGSIAGTITDQEDLMTFLDDYATQEWVEGKGYLVSADLSQYATRQWVTGRGYITSDALDGYATETWVGQQGYITSSALSGYATQEWVGDQGYIDSIKTVNNQSLVGEGNIEISGLTPEQEDAVDMLMNHEGGVLYTRELLPYTTSRYTVGVGDSSFQRFMFNLGGDVYCVGNQNLFKWNEIDFNFDRLFSLSSFSWQPLWMDATGRVYMGYEYEVNMTTGQVDSIDLGDVAGYYYHYSDNMHNIFTGKNGIYLVNYEKAFKFNETNQEFDEITLSNPDSLDLGYVIASKLVDYEGHLVMVFDGRMYEFNEYGDRVEVVEVQQPYFPVLNFNNDNIDSQYFHKIGSDYLYLKEYIHSKLDNGQWTHIEIKNPEGYSIQYYWGPGVNQGEYLMGYNNASTYDVLVTVAGDGYDSMNWTKVSSVAVDLNSMQTIYGSKTFESTINARGGLQITNVNAYGNDTNILLAKNRTEAESMSFLVPGLFTLNGDDIATTQDCIMNRETLYTGPRFTGVCNYPYSYNRENFWTTPSGRLFSTETWGTNTYEFDGDGFNEIHLAAFSLPGNAKKVNTSDGKLYCYYNNWLHYWNEEHSGWYQYEFGELSIGDTIWSVGETIRCGSDYIWSVYQWVYDPVQDYKGPYSELVGDDVYVHADNKIYRYEESTKTYTELGSYTDWGTNNWFVFEDELYYTGGDNVVYKIDFSRVGSGNDLNVPTDIVCDESAQFYGRYGDYLWTAMNNGMFGYTYDVNETVPEPEDGEGDYVLTASVDEYERVNYSWDKGNILKLVEKEGIDFPVVDRPDDNPDPDGYNSSEYILSMSEYYGTIEQDGDEIRTKSVTYIGCEGSNIFQKQFIYHEVDGEWELQNEYMFDPALIGDGWDVAWIHDLSGDPVYQGRLEDFPIDTYVDHGYDKLPFGMLDDDGESLSFNGCYWDQENEKLGLYKVTPNIVPGVGLDGYDESFIPFVAAEEPDTSTDATYVLKATVLDGEVTYEWVPEV